MFPTRNISEEFSKEAESHRLHVQAMEEFVDELFRDSRGRKLRKVGKHTEREVRFMIGLDKRVNGY